MLKISRYHHSCVFLWIKKEQKQIVPVVYLFKMCIFDKTLLLQQDYEQKPLFTSIVAGQVGSGFFSLNHTQSMTLSSFIFQVDFLIFNID